MSKVGKRDRSAHKLHAFNIEIKVENHAYLKAVARARGKSMGQYIDEFIEKKREKYTASRAVQDANSSCNANS